MIRRNTRGGKTRLAGPPSSRTRSGEWDEELRAALEAVAAEEEKEASRAAGASAATTAKKGAAAGKKKAGPPPPAPAPLPLPPLPPPPPPQPAFDREETFARGTLMLQPMHKSQRLVDARERRRMRRAFLSNGVLAATAAAGQAKAELDAAALAKRAAEQQGRGGSHLRKLEEKRLEWKKKHAEAAKKVREARESLEAAAEARKLRLRARGKAAAADERPPSEDDESDFSDVEKHHWEREPRTLVSGRCWVDLRNRSLDFFWQRQEEYPPTPEEPLHVHRWFFLKNTQITARVPGPPYPPGEEGEEPVPQLFPDAFALELAEFPMSRLNVEPDPEEASGDLRDALARPEAVEERRVGRSARMRAAEEEATFDLRVVVQQLSAEDVEKFLTRQPIPPPQSPPFVLPFDDDEEEEVEEEEEVKEKGKEKDKEGGKGKQRSAPPAPPSSSSSSSSPRPPAPPIEIKPLFGFPDDVHTDFYEFYKDEDDEEEEGTTAGGRRASRGTRRTRKVRAVAFRVQALRVPSTQPRRLAAAAAAAAASYAPGGPFAKEAPRAMQHATLLLDSAEDFEKVVLALRAAEEAEARSRALELAHSRRRRQAQEAARRRQLEQAMLAAGLRARGLGMLWGGLEGGGGGGELELPPAEPVVFECARLRAVGDDADYLDDLNPVKLMYSLSPAARGAFRGTADRGRGMNPFDLQLPSDRDGRDARGRALRIPVVPTAREE